MRVMAAMALAGRPSRLQGSLTDTGGLPDPEIVCVCLCVCVAVCVHNLVDGGGELVRRARWCDV